MSKSNKPKVKFPANWINKIPLPSKLDTESTLLNHCTKLKPHLYHVHTRIQGFKKLQSSVLANLIIPVGALVVYGDERKGTCPNTKLRANVALCESLYRGINSYGYASDYSYTDWEHGEFVDTASSKFQTSFTYKAISRALSASALRNTDIHKMLVEHANDLDGVIHPEYAFDINDSTCASGIHFFTTLHAALNYR